MKKKHNPIARVLRDRRYGQRVMKDPRTYTRKIKHRGRNESSDLFDIASG